MITGGVISIEVAEKDWITDGMILRNMLEDQITLPASEFKFLQSLDGTNEAVFIGDPESLLSHIQNKF